MPVGKEFFELAVNEGPCKETAECAERQFVINLILEDAGVHAVSSEAMSMLPSAERAGELHVAKLAALDVVAVFEDPQQPEWTKRNADCAALAVADAR